MLPVGADQIADIRCSTTPCSARAGSTLGHQAVAMAHHHLAHGARDGAELGLRGHAVGGALYDARRDLLLEARDPYLEELVQVAAEDGEELDPLEQRRPGVEGLVQDPPVELQPAELPVQVERGVPQVGGGCEREGVAGGRSPPNVSGRAVGRKCHVTDV